MADFPISSTMNASVLRKIKKPLIEKKGKTKIAHDQLKITLEENVEKNKPQVSRLDKADNLEQSANDLQQLPKQEITSTEERDYTRIDEFKYGDEECMRKIVNYLNSATEITHVMKSGKASHLSSCINEVNDAESTVKYLRENSAIHSTLGVPGKSTYFTPLHVDIPSTTQYPSTTAMTPDSNGGLLMPIPGYPVIKTDDPYSPYYYPTQQKNHSVSATPTDDTLLNESSGNNLLNEQPSEGHSAARRLFGSNSAENASVTRDTVWRPW